MARKMKMLRSQAKKFLLIIMSNSNQYSSNQQVYYPQNDFQQQNKLKVQQRKNKRWQRNYYFDKHTNHKAWCYQKVVIVL